MIFIAFGTRPEYIKLKSLINIIKENNIPHVCVFVNQHDKIFAGIEDLNFEEIQITKGNKNRLNQIVSDVCSKITFPENTKLVVVQGDTATSFAVALAAYNNNIKVAHVEAGLRTWDLENPYPEEGYRRMIDSISTYHFCPTDTDLQNISEKYKGSKSYVTGNTVIDTLPDYDIQFSDEVYITLHRRENHEILDKWISEIEKLAIQETTTKFFFIKHPNPNVLKYLHMLKNVNILDPMPHDELLKIIAQRAKLLITDSGGLQEEASHYNKFCLVCRKVTERPSKSSVCIEEPSDLIKFYNLYKNKRVVTRGSFGAGDSSNKIIDILKSEKII